LAGFTGTVADFLALPADGDDFTLVYLPDTQMYPLHLTAYMADQINWIVAQQAALNIQFVMHEGDMVDSVTWEQLDFAQAAMAPLQTAHVPTLIAPGNHDYLGAYTLRDLTNWKSRFPATWYTDQAWFAGGFYNNEHSNVYCTRTIGSRNYIFIALEYYPRAEVLTWLAGVLDAHPSHAAILVTHAYMRAANDMMVEGSGIREVVAQHGTPLLIGSGHFIVVPSDPVGDRMDWLGSGQRLIQFIINYQDMPNDGEGYLRIIKVKPSVKAMLHQTYSPTLDTYNTGAEYEFVSAW
jgi:hypothetical protein